jgi:uncharacterized membrane protein
MLPALPFFIVGLMLRFAFVSVLVAAALIAILWLGFSINAIDSAGGLVADSAGWAWNFLSKIATSQGVLSIAVSLISFVAGIAASYRKEANNQEIPSSSNNCPKPDRSERKVKAKN